VWQALRTQLHPKGVEIVTVALDTGGAEAARPFIDAAAPQHPSLIDAAHLCDDLLGMVNVPSWVWIDEHGMIVRPAEPAWPGSSPMLDALPALTADLPAATQGVVGEIRKMNIDPQLSLTMLLDWVEHGASSKYVMTPDQVVARSEPRGIDEARAAAHFELGQHLYALGDHVAAQVHWRAATTLFPSNWTYKRQAWNLAPPDEAVAQGSNWLNAVQATGAENYYPKVTI
jgi:hypothetical protein